MSEAGLEPRRDFISAGPFRLSYAIDGQGRPALVIGSALYYPRTFSSRLRNGLRMAFIDHRGFAAVSGPIDPKQYSFDLIIEDIEEARRRLGLNRSAVIGHSGHAYMALEYAKKHPQHVSHVILIAAAPDLSPASGAAAERYWQDFASPERKAIMEERLRALPDAVLERLTPSQQFIQRYIRNAPRAWYRADFDASPLWQGVDINMDVFGHVWGEVFRDIDITQGLADFDRPVFLALGRSDFLMAPPASWEPILPNFRDSTVRIFECSGHTPQYEEPELFDAELLRWMDSKE